MGPQADRPTWYGQGRNRISTLAEMHRPEKRAFQVGELTDLHFYMSLEGNLWVIRRALIKEVFNSREDTVFNFNYQPSPRAAIGQIICPAENAELVTRELEKNGMQRLPVSYDPLGLSPRNNSMGMRRKKTLQRHRENVARNWERCASSPRE